MLEKLYGSCKTCGDERIFTVTRIIERNKVEFFVYVCGSCEVDTIERAINAPEPIEPEREAIVICEVLNVPV